MCPFGNSRSHTWYVVSEDSENSRWHVASEVPACAKTSCTKASCYYRVVNAPSGGGLKFFTVILWSYSPIFVHTNLSALEIDVSWPPPGVQLPFVGNSPVEVFFRMKSANRKEEWLLITFSISTKAPQLPLPQTQNIEVARCCSVYHSFHISPCVAVNAAYF